jgi:signal peptidase I
MSKLPPLKKETKAKTKPKPGIWNSILSFFSPQKKDTKAQTKSTDTSKDKKKKKPQTPLEFIKELAIVFGIFLILNSFVLASFEVPTGSMENTVMTGDFLFVNKFIFGGTSPRTVPFTSIRIPWFRIPALRDVRRGDVIVFEFPGNREEVLPEFVYYLKRCVGIPGDTLQVVNKVLYVNGIALPLPKHLKFENSSILPKTVKNDRTFPPGSDFNEDNYGPIRIPKKGDVIDLSIDNIIKWETFIKREGHSLRIDGSFILIDGKPNSKYVVEDDYYFGMGDNRDNSLDSRFWGFIPKTNIVGTPMIVYWSWNPDIPLWDIFNKLGSIKFGRVGTLIN